MPVLHCPRCDKRLTVSDWAPPVLTCPDCFARVPNPGGAQHGIQLAPPLPRRVIPIEEQVERDAWVSGGVMFVLAALLGGAAWLTFQVADLRNIAYALAFIATLVIVTAVVQLSFPESPHVAAASGILRTFASGIVKVILILFGLLLLLLGTCAVIIGGSNWHGS